MKLRAKSRSVATCIWLATLAALTVITAGVEYAHAQAYPTRPIRIIVPYPPGNGADIATRRVADALQSILSQTVIVENRGGAGGNIGAATAARSDADGYTLLTGTAATQAANQFLYDKITFDPVKDFTPIVPLVTYGMVIAVAPSSPIKNLPDLIAQAKAKPGKITAAIPSSTSRLVLELLKTAAGIDILPVPYTSTPAALTDTMSSRVDLLIDTSSGLVGSIHGGQVRPLAIATEKRLDSYPDLPTFREQGTDVVHTTPNGLFGPRGIPPEVVKTINAAVNKVLQDPALRKRFFDEGTEPNGGTPEDLDKAMVEQRVKWENVVKATGMKAS